MEFFSVKGNRGQAAIEFIFLVAVMLLFIQTIIQPNVNLAVDSAKEVARLAEARLAAEKIANTTNLVGTLGIDTKQTITVFVPAGSKVLCKEATKKIGFETELINTDLSHPACDATGKCALDLDILEEITLRCINGTEIEGPQMKRVIVQKITADEVEVRI
ncbi:MAG: hypothetical protein J4224_01835 [Candidatus Diapherotrites archaeon]|uniref:Class III signal peptide-containing protein n=1 Tax=Candidatus Iainarchaeum sp. TaxID=3101447 RepID=A0A7J4ITL7_9ARCH|nr:hypothetical protein [Candidatus Diapherotrites archaeon]HIH08170.1 hypothetical protein [Candidatus Diapherotrites archaeon]